MNKSSGAISLVLLGTALALAGCSSQSDEEGGDWSEDDGQQGHRGHVVAPIVGPRFGGGLGGGRGSVGAVPSARGGFGGIGSGGVGS